ncbi:ATP-binding protein [Ectothiorhodospira mobilis]|uniref:ATP-binding protein n=1 Tax=Ectothiorhodospira mobilis TaxID=195064 RepID=UPI001EE78BB1|nr:ATP-binding protein [Ectothiorhodospira mobilis]MCG5535729.1 ATP-binding protein [Ectothiorhodospira mobilis]
MATSLDQPPQALVTAITSAARDAIVMMDAHGRIVFWNPAAESLLGYRAEEVLGRELHACMTPHGVSDAMRASLERFFHSGTGERVGRTVEVQARHRDGTPMDMELSLSAFPSGEGWHAVGILRDLGGRKRTEARLMRLNDCLARLGPDYRDNIASITQVCGELLESDAAIYHRLEGERLCVLGGWRTPKDMPAEDDPEGHVCYDMIRGVHGDLYAAPDLARTCYAHTDPYVRRYELRAYLGHVVRCGDAPVGSLCVVFRSEYTPTEEDRRVVGILAAALSAEEGRHKAVCQWRRAKEEAERASRAKSEFLSRMSHELRTPMNAVLGFSQLLEADPALGGEQRAHVHEILRGGRHLLALINEVLDLSRVESGRLELSMEPVPLGEVVDECITLLAPLAREAGVDLQVHPLDAVLVADRIRLKQVLINLISNAIKYNRSGGWVQVLQEFTGSDAVRVQVRDTGPGIPEGLRQELFKPFSRLHEQTHPGSEGTGIGLAICQRLVGLMQGDMGYEAMESGGSCFWFQLQRGRWSTPAPRSGDEGFIERSAPEPYPFTLLHVDDNPSNLRLVEQALSRRPAVRVISAPSAGLGLELAGVHRPDLIVLDINMPGLNGYQVLEQLRGDPVTATIPVVALTANATERDVERGRRAGFDDYLTKPLDLERFLGAVDTRMAAAGGLRRGFTDQPAG